MTSRVVEKNVLEFLVERKIPASIYTNGRCIKACISKVTDRGIVVLKKEIPYKDIEKIEIVNFPLDASKILRGKKAKYFYYLKDLKKFEQGKVIREDDYCILIKSANKHILLFKHALAIFGDKIKALKAYEKEEPLFRKNWRNKVKDFLWKINKNRKRKRKKVKAEVTLTNGYKLKGEIDIRKYLQIKDRFPLKIKNKKVNVFFHACKEIKIY